MAFTAILAGVGIGQGFLIFEQIKLGRREFEATHRPWIALRNCNLSESLIVDKGRILIPVVFDIENTGTVHADRFFLFGDSVAGFEKVSVEAEISKLIKNVGTAKRNGVPYEVIFPQEKTTHKTLFDVSTVDENRRDALRRAAYLLVYGVFFYESPLDQILRYTSFSYGLYLDPAMLVCDEEGPWPVIPPDKVKIYKYQFGWSAT